MPWGPKFHGPRIELFTPAASRSEQVCAVLMLVAFGPELWGVAAAFFCINLRSPL